MDLAASIQQVTEEILLRMTRAIAKETGERNLCLAGGVALNCVANGKVLRDGSFDRIWIQPAAGDAGGSIGAALCAYHLLRDQPRRAHDGADGMRGAFLGPRTRRTRSCSACAPPGRGFASCRAMPRSTRRSTRSPPARRSAGSRAAWNSGRARSAAARSSAIRARRRCRSS
jgi:predicted NodU family carbamoyl transferase